jgi:hypothetical protein
MKQERLIKEKPKSKRHSKLNKWFKQANRSSKEHSWIENPIISTAATPEIATVITVKIRHATTAATSAGIPMSEETSV